MTYPQPTEPQIFMEGVADPGSPNFERVIMRVTGAMSLAGFGVTIAVKNGGGFHPLFDNCFWFPDIATAGDAWVVLYSKRGSPEWTEHQGTPVLSVFWQRDRTIFSRLAPNVIPLLFKTEGAVGGDLL